MRVMYRHNCVKKIAALIGGAMSGVLSTHAYSASDSSAGKLQELEEIVVTAQKRVENLQDVPISITALSSKALEAQNVTDTNSFAKEIPSLHIKQGTTGTITLAIRGISNNDPANPGYENAVGIYTDGVYSGISAGSLFDLGDVERIEVLRGPQGTLYGRNTIGGAINVISKRPSGELSGSVKVGFGNYNLRTTNASIDLPTFGKENDGLGTVKARLSVFERKSGTVTPNVPVSYTTVSKPTANFSGFGNTDRNGFHLGVDWQPSSSVQVAYDYSQFKADDRQRLFQIIDVVRPSTLPVGFENYIPPGQPPAFGTANQAPFFKTDNSTHALTLTWTLNEHLTLKSITGYRKLQTSDAQDLDGSNTAQFDSQRYGDFNQTTEELQLLGTHQGLKYVVGAYYSKEKQKSVRAQQFSNGATTRNTNAHLNNRNSAIFGQIDYTPEAMPKLSLSLGARHTNETKEMSRYIMNYSNSTGVYGLVNPAPNLVLPPIEFSNSSVMFSPSYRITDKLNVYYKYSEGFRSGGYDGVSATIASASVPFKPEELKTHEIGMKSRWLENRLDLNMALFRSYYDDQQVNSFTGTTSAVLNAGKSKINGAELEAKALLMEGLQAGLGLSFLNYSYQKFDMGPTIGDVAERARMNNAPRHTANLSVDYSFPRFSFGKLALHLNYNYVAAAEAIAIKTNGAAPNSKLDARGLYDARIVLSGVKVGNESSLQFALWGMNLTNKRYIDGLVDFNTFRAGTLGMPRTYGGDVTLNF
ncbi:TonB-dependent receptor [Denitratisoma oestradiolicum]|uniref:Putative TonB-dependent receptor n=1 Tax=Denitratisoma oestradiolicum TaxID=311182 RepID=A0A6S6XYI6_9PROT|nr:TonB-dependent receptor [Denitratisoma oestradiolicum]CAB1371056.1 putative TonB-dependent receptor [Denitratisoma oestradiolicum]